VKFLDFPISTFSLKKWDFALIGKWVVEMCVLSLVLLVGSEIACEWVFFFFFCSVVDFVVNF
jgi:hypothetical protein